MSETPHGDEYAPPTAALTEEGEKLPVRTKAAFGVGGISEGAIGIAFGAFAMLFYRNQLDLSGTLAGAAIMLALVVDAVSDPLIGSISDRVRTRYGRRHPFLFAAPIPLAACFTAIFMPPEGLGTWGLFAWLTTFAILMRTFLTFYHVPHLALGAELSPNYIERTRVMSHNAIYQLVGGATAYFVGWTWLGSVEGGIASRSAFGWLGAGVAIAAALSILVSAWFTRDRIPKLFKPPSDLPKLSLAQLGSEIGSCLQNRNYVMLLLGLVCLGAATGLRENLGSFMNLFFWELQEDQIRWFAAASPPSYVLAFVFTTQLHHRLDKRETMLGAMTVVMLAGLIPVASRFLGIFPDNGAATLFPLLLGAVFVFYLGVAILTITVMSALADVADQHELESGRRQEGIFYSARTFFGKVTTALGMMISGVGLDLIGFSAHSVPGEVPGNVLVGLGVLDAIVPAIPSTLAIFCYGAYAIDKHTHARIRDALKSRRGESPA